MYQGYTNWETWAVSLYCDNTFEVYQRFMDEIEQLRGMGVGHDDQSITTIMAEQIMTLITLRLPQIRIEIVGTDQYIDLTVVNWEEVAESFVAE